MTRAAVNDARPPMRQATEGTLGMQHFAAEPANAFTAQDEAALGDALKRGSGATRRTGSAQFLPAIVHGLIEHFVEGEARAKLSRSDDNLRLVEDLAIDSLTMMEIVFLAEDVLQVSIDNEELRPFRTVGDIKRFLASKLRRGSPAVPALTAGGAA